MSADRQQLAFGVAGQTLVLDAPEGRASAITSVTVYAAETGDGGTAESATTGSAAVESAPSTTISAAAGISQTNPRTMTVAATTGITTGRTYLLRASVGTREWVEVASLSGSVLTARRPLVNDFASGSALEGTRLSVTVDTTWASDTANLSPTITPGPGYRVRWVYTVDSVVRVRVSYFDLVRVAATHSVTLADVDRLCPGVLYWLPTDHRVDAGAALLTEAQSLVSLDWYASGLPLAQARDSDVVGHLIRRKFVQLAQEAALMAGATNRDAAAAAADWYYRDYNRLVRDGTSSAIPIATESTGAAAAARPAAVVRR